MNILIIDDDSQNVREIKQGLIRFGLNEQKIFPSESHIDRISSKISEYASVNQYDVIYQKLKMLIKKENIDLVFMDLNLTGNEHVSETSGQKLIEMFAQSDEQFLSELPIVVISKHDKNQLPAGLIQMVPYLHIKKSASFDRDEFREKVVETKLNAVWESVVSRYIKIKTNENYQKDLVYIKEKLNQINYEDKLNSILGTIDSINNTSLENNEKLQTIEIFSKSIIKTLPLLASTNNVKKVFNSLEIDEIDKVLGSEFPVHLKDTLYSKIKELSQNGVNSSMEFLVEEAKKEVVKYISSQANFEEGDNIVEKTGKLVIYLYNKVVNG